MILEIDLFNKFDHSTFYEKHHLLFVFFFFTNFSDRKVVGHYIPKKTPLYKKTVL